MSDDDELYPLCCQCWLDGRDGARIAEFRVQLYGARLVLCGRHREELKKAVLRHADILGISPVELALAYTEKLIGGIA